MPQQEQRRVHLHHLQKGDGTLGSHHPPEFEVHSRNERYFPIFSWSFFSSSALTLWKPELVGAGASHLRISGMEAKGEGDRRRWFAQQWYCEVLTHQRAVTYFEKRMITGELPSIYGTNRA